MASEKQKRLVGCLIGLVALAVLLGVLWEAFLRLRDAARLASCRPMAIADTCWRFAEDNEGMFPPLSSKPGVLMFDESMCARLYPVSDYACPFDRDGDMRGLPPNTPIDDWSYVYLGYFLENEEQVLAFVEAYRGRVAAGEDFTSDIEVEAGKGNLGGTTLYRLREIDALPEKAAPLVQKAASIPVAVEWPGNHRHMGGNVAFLDGHTEFLRYPGEFPMTKAFIEALRELDALGAQ